MNDEVPCRQPYVVEEPTMLAGDHALDYAQYRSVGPAPAQPAPRVPPPDAPRQDSSDVLKAWVRQNQQRFFELQKSVQARPTLQADFIAAKAAHDGNRKAGLAAQRQLDAAERALAAAKEEELDWTENHHFSRKFRSDHAKENVQQARAKFQANRERISKLADQKSKLDQATAQTEKDLNISSGALAHQKHQVAEMKEILEKLFGGYMAGDPAENAAERKVTEGVRRLNAIRSAAADHKIALTHANSAVDALEQMGRALEVARRNNQIDMWQKDGFSQMYQQRVNKAMTQAQQLAQKADASLKIACKHSPNIPVARKVEVPASQFSQFRALVFDSSFSDIRQGHKIAKCAAQARGAYQEALNSYGWQREMCRNINKDLIRTEAELAKDRATLTSERTRLISIAI